MATATILIGIPGSGKSTLARELARLDNALVISLDQLRGQLYGDESIQGEWSQLWHHIQVAMQGAIAVNRSIVYDATNYRPRYRREISAYVRGLGFSPTIGLWLNEPLWVCLMRNQYRDRRVPDATIAAMHRCLQEHPPSLQEGFDRLLYRQETKESEWLD